MSTILEQEIKYLQGVGPKRADLLNKELNIFLFEDMLYYFPYRYTRWQSRQRGAYQGCHPQSRDNHRSVCG